MSDQQYPTVFVVDPDDGIRDGIRLFLDSYDFDVKSYPDGETFLREALPADSDCILLESELRGIGGLEVLHKLRAQGKLVPVILLTSSLDAGLSQDAQKLGVISVIHKPLINRKLFSTLQSVLNKTLPQTTARDQMAGPSENEKDKK